MARSEYSRLRDIAVKRIARLEKAGLAMPGINIPKVSDLGDKRSRERAAENLKQFLASGTTVREIRKSGGVVAPSRKGIADVSTPEKIHRREKQKEARARRAEVLSGLTKNQRNMLKGAKTLGIRLPTNQIMAFVEYMEYRFDQISESQFYLFANYAEDFQQIMKKSPSIGDIRADFNRFLADRDSLESLFASGGGYDESALQALWSEYVKE